MAEATSMMVPWTHDLRAVHVAPTERCNLDCRFCYRRPGAEDLPTEFLLSLVEQISELGPKVTMMLAGGEPLLHPGLERVLAASGEAGVQTMVSSNGLKIDRPMGELLRSSGAGLVCVSVQCDRLVGTERAPGGDGGGGGGTDGNTRASWERAFAELLEAEVPCAANLLVTHQDLERLPEAFDTLGDLGVRRINLLRPKPDHGGGWFTGARLRPGDMRRLQRHLLRRQGRQGLEIRLDCSLGMLLDGLSREAVSEDGEICCAAGVDYMSVDVDGRVYPCPDLRRPELAAGRLGEDDLRELWRRPGSFGGLRGARELTGWCGECYLEQVCGGCRARALEVCGSILGGDPECHRVEEGRWRRLFNTIGVTARLGASWLAGRRG